MEFLVRAPGSPERLGILPGTFHPPTRAHLALGRAGLVLCDEVLFVLPRELPHKRYEEVGFADRARMLVAAVEGEPRFSAGVSQGGLFAEIAEECRAAYGPATRLGFLCGRDAAERIVGWDYGREGAIGQMLEGFDLLVAARGGEYAPPPALARHIHAVKLIEDMSAVSATEVRRRIREGPDWRNLVPPSVVPLVEEIYGGAAR
jgi:nicotinate-nucleotide adenylyltransferase